MDALMAALVLGALTQVGDRTPWLAAILAHRVGTATAILCGSLALAANYAIGVVGGRLIAPLLTPNASLLLLALALLLAGASTPFRSKEPDRLENWTIGALPTAMLGLFIMAFGDRMQFIAAALAIRSPVPWLAAVGATLGAGAVLAAAVAMGEARWTALPHRAIRIGTAAILLIAGVATGLNALRLV